MDYYALYNGFEKDAFNLISAANHTIESINKFISFHVVSFLTLGGFYDSIESESYAILFKRSTQILF